MLYTHRIYKLVILTIIEVLLTLVALAIVALFIIFARLIILTEKYYRSPRL